MSDARLGERLDDAADTHEGDLPPLTLRAQLLQSALLILGAIIAGVAYAIAGWIVGLFAPFLPLPPGTRLALAIVFFSILVYFAAFDMDEEDVTLIERGLRMVSR